MEAGDALGGGRRGASRCPSATRWSATHADLSRDQCEMPRTAPLIDQAGLHGQQAEEQVARRVARIGHGRYSQSIEDGTMPL